MEKNRIYLSNYAFSKRKSNSKILFAILVTLILVACSTSIVLAAEEDNVVITFDPQGEIDIDVSLATYNFSTVYAGTWKNSSGGTFTLYNNGTIPMDTEIYTNATTDEKNMSLNATGVAPDTDEYAIYIEDLDFPGYLNTTWVLFDYNLSSKGNKQFDICLFIGVNLTANYSWQTTTIYLRGSVT